MLALKAYSPLVKKSGHLHQSRLDCRSCSGAAHGFALESSAQHNRGIHGSLLCASKDNNFRHHVHSKQVEPDGYSQSPVVAGQDRDGMAASYRHISFFVFFSTILAFIQWWTLLLQLPTTNYLVFGAAFSTPAQKQSTHSIVPGTLPQWADGSTSIHRFRYCHA